MSRRPPPTGFVNLHGEAVDPRQRAPEAPGPRADDGEPLAEADLQTLFDVVCLGGSAHGKTWYTHCLRALEWRSADGSHHLSADEVARGLRQLVAQGRVRAAEPMGWNADPVAWQQRWPALWRHADAPRFWRAWCVAGSGGSTSMQHTPAWAPLRQPDDAEALARLVLLSRPSAQAFHELAERTLGRAASPEALLGALAEPFDPDFLAALPPDLLWGLVNRLQLQAPEALALRPALAGWIDHQLADCSAEQAAQMPPQLWLGVAERRLEAGDAAGCRRALAALPVTLAQRPLFEALLQIWQGDWAAGTEAFAAGYKEMARLAGKRRGLVPEALLQWQLLGWMAQHQPAAWTAARKLAIGESGSRTPSPHDGWGRFAHAAALRLGEAGAAGSAFDLPAQRWGTPDARGEALRLVLAAWVGHTPQGWSDAAVAQVLERLHRQGQHWLADLAAQAVARLGWTVPPRPDEAPPPWGPAFYPAPAAAWREALAAITALGDGGSPAEADGAPVPLHWRLTLDAAGRPHHLEAFARKPAARGGARLEALSLSALKKATRLDARDAAVARCLRQAEWNKRVQWLDLASAVAALVGHPDLALADAPEQPLMLAEGLPQIELRREPQADGSEAYRLHADELAADAPPLLEHHWGDVRDAEEMQRRDAVRVRRDAPDRARLLRITPAQRRVVELAAKPWAVPLQAEAELAGALRALAGHFNVHSDAAAGREVPSESRLVAQLTPRGGVLLVRLAVRPFAQLSAGAGQPPGPLLVPGLGRSRLLVQRAGESLSTRRDLDAERRHLAELCAALPFLPEPDEQGGWAIDQPELALATIETLGRHLSVAAIEWPQGQPLRVIAPAEPRLEAVVRSGGRDWLGVDATLKVDDGQVLNLRQLLALVAESGGSRFVPLGENAWLALTDRLRQQLADLAALAEAAPGAAAGGKKGRPGEAGVQLPASAAAWLAEALGGDDGSAPGGDRAWQQRVQQLARAAALAPEPPPALQATLRPYQAEGFAWLVRRTAAGFGAVLADDMGLGKTLQTLALLLQRMDQGPALVVAPTSVVANWAAEAARFAPGLRLRDHAVEREAALADLAPGDLVLTSYGLLLREAEAFGRIAWGTLVLDEAQALKNAATQRAKAVAELQAGARIALSGTPVENRLADLWSLMNLLNPGLLGSAQRFNERFANAIERQRNDGVRQRLKRIVAPFILRRTKAQVLDDLPPRTEIVHRIEPGDDERALTEALRRQAVERVSLAAKGGGHAAVQVLAELTRLRRAACDPRLVLPGLSEAGLQHGGAKLQAIATLVQELVDGRHQALLFSQFTDFLDRIGEQLQAMDIPFQRLDGSTPAAQRAQRVAAFQRGEGAVFLISLKAGGFGLNLTAADYVIIADPWWNPAAEDQASGRAHRMGQLRPVTVYRLVLAGSVEERIVALHHEKRALADGLLEGQDAAGAVVDAEVLMELLRG